MKEIFFLLGLMFSIICYSQTNYPSGNAAYNTEKLLGFNPVTISGGSCVYTYDNLNNFYKSIDKILIPDIQEISDGNFVAEDTFFGFDIGGFCSNLNFQWDNQIQISSTTFDRNNLFVSPVSTINMAYGKVLQYTNDTCYYADCLTIIDGPDSSLIYPQFSPLSGTYDLWAGEELIDAGDLKGTGTSQKISQQQADSTLNCSYCVKTYGPGWRLPTDIEAGHFNDEEGLGNGFDQGYTSNDSSCYIWTSSLFIVYNVKRWTVRMTDGTWENCAGFLNVPNKVRCVYSAGDYSTKITNNNENNLCSIYPNPTNNHINISFDKEGEKLIRIYNINSTLITELKTYDKALKIDLKEFSKGVYIIKIISNKSIYSNIISVI
ncbi:MAG: T9SS type A sorting domain-containing protein [Bacteroidota bacterium]